MAAKHILAIDQGTTSTRAIVFDASGRPAASAQKELPQIFPKPGWVEHDPEQIWSATVEVCRVNLSSVDFTTFFQRVDEEWFVFIPRSQGVFEMRPVERGRNMEGEIEIVKGLKAGETVVVEGAFLLKAEAEKARGEGKEHD